MSVQSKHGEVRRRRGHLVIYGSSSIARHGILESAVGTGSVIEQINPRIYSILAQDLSPRHEIDNRTFCVAIAGIASSARHTLRAHLPFAWPERPTRSPCRRVDGENRLTRHLRSQKKCGSQSACPVVSLLALVGGMRHTPETLRSHGMEHQLPASQLRR